jgi:hypothetical protein
MSMPTVPKIDGKKNLMNIFMEGLVYDSFTGEYHIS